MDAASFRADALRWEAEMSESELAGFAEAKMIGSVTQHGDAYLAQRTAQAEERRWPLPLEQVTAVFDRQATGRQTPG